MTLEEFVDQVKHRRQDIRMEYVAECHRLTRRVEYNNAKKMVYENDLASVTRRYEHEQTEIKQTLKAVKDGHTNIVVVTLGNHFGLATWLAERQTPYHRTRIGAKNVYLLKDPDVAFEFKMRWGGV
ncbi:MAG: hypothetical protein EOO77_25000 [Oxalobacteraceae bacterium]|nr:MAG: hypothetical protein EOO77_25000 [Oxalobacteraceae bacterium]